MSPCFTQSQIQKLRELGLNLPKVDQNIAKFPPTIAKPHQQPLVSSHNTSPLNTPIFPLLSISGLTMISIGSLILFKSKSESITIPPSTIYNPPSIQPTQVPKSIQHYLLASQQYFSQALQNQQSQGDQNLTVNLLNQAITTATQATSEYPTDYRGYDQRARIYQSLSDSQPTLIDQALSDFSLAIHLNPSSPDLTRQLASLYAKKGNASLTIQYLAQTVVLEPTKAQNFYDLAKIQQQAGLIADAVKTYSQLITILPDPSQKQQVETEKNTLEQLLSQAPQVQKPLTSPPTIQPTKNSEPAEGPLLRADTLTGLIIAAPETSKNITVSGQTESNALSGTASLPANQVNYLLSNSHITPSSQVYISLVSGGKNQILKVLSKSTGSATIGFDSPISENVEFKWWIIN